jgi:hypothetical protein
MMDEAKHQFSNELFMETGNLYDCSLAHLEAKECLYLKQGHPILLELETGFSSRGISTGP